MELHQSQLPDGLHWGTESDELDELFDVLSNSRRRAVLHYLKQHTGDCPIGISELSRVLAAWEQDIPKEQVAYDDRHSVHTSLQQFHLPKMADSGLVSYNEQETEVGLTPLADGLDVYVETVSAEPSVSVHLLGADVGCIERHAYDPGEGAVDPFVSGYTNVECETAVTGHDHAHSHVHTGDDHTHDHALGEDGA